MSKSFVKIPVKLVKNAAVHSDAELGFIARLAADAHYGDDKEITLKDGTQCVLRVGEMIVAERDLAEQAGVHRTTIRRLLERLERAGICVRRNANQRSSNGTILGWTFLQENQQVDSGCRTDAKPSSRTDENRTETVSEPGIYNDVDSRQQTVDTESPPTPSPGDEPVLFDAPASEKAKAGKSRKTAKFTETSIKPLFEEFASSYPPNDTGHNWVSASALFLKMVNRGIDPKALIAAAGRFGDEMKAKRWYGGQFVKGPYKWMFHGDWKKYDGVHQFPVPDKQQDGGYKFEGDRNNPPVGYDDAPTGTKKGWWCKTSGGWNKYAS